MKLSIPKNEFIEGLDLVKLTVGNSELGAGYLFEVGEYETTVITSSGRSRIEFDLYYGSDCGGVGSFCLPASLYGCVDSIPAESVLIEVDLDTYRAVISGGGVSFTIDSVSADGYNMNYDLGDIVAKVKFNSDYLSDAIRLLNNIKPNLHVVAGSESLKGFIFQKDHLVTTDTHRVGALKFDGNLPDVSIDRQFMSNVSKSIKGTGSVTMEIGSKGIKVYNDFMRMFGKVIEGMPAPDLLGFFNREHRTVCRVAGFLLSEIMDQAKGVDSKSVKLVVSDGRLVVFAGQSFEKSIPVVVEGDSIERYVNPVFFDLAKNAVDNISISFKDEKDPIILEWEGFRYLILPVMRSS